MVEPGFYDGGTGGDIVLAEAGVKRSAAKLPQVRRCGLDGATAGGSSRGTGSDTITKNRVTLEP